MHSNNNHINKRLILTRKWIETYQTTKNEAIRHQIERSVLDDPFENDALDGFSENQLSPSSMAKIDNRFVSKKSWFLWSASGFLLILFFGYFVYPKSRPEQVHVAKSILKHVEKTDIVLTKQIKKMVELPVNKRIAAKKLTADFIAMETNQENYLNPENVLEIEAPIKTAKNDQQETSIVKKYIKAKEIYLHNLKLVDYREYRSEPKIPTEQYLLSGTPANMDHIENQNDESQWKTVHIPYIDYLDRTMFLFSKGQNKNALARLQVILETYPNDVNANFYAGLIYYNLNEFETAQESFRNCLISKYDNFQEEAEWYLAISLSASGQHEEADALFYEIEKNGGFYSKDAKKALSN